MMLIIGRATFEAMVAHLKAVYPLEGCGLMAGSGDRVWQLYPVDNRLNSRTAYEMEPKQLVAAMMDMEAQGQSLLAIYHSHPGGAAVLSPTDIAQANYPEAVQIVVSLAEPEQPQTAAFQIVEGRVSAVTLKVV